MLKDVSGLGVERNVFRYVPVPVTIRFDGNFLFELIRVLLAAARTGAPVAVSSRTHCPTASAQGADRGARRLAGVRRRDPAGTHTTHRHGRQGDRRRSRRRSGRRDLRGPVTLSGRVEALPFLQEQAISITNHRFGNHDAEFELVLPRKH